jgi:hydroxymethylbilane synthase
MRRPSDVLKAGTRTSPLALVQTKDVLRRLAESFGVRAEIVELSSPGDRDKTSDLRASAPDFFTKDIDEALLSGAIDFAIHSAKDMPETTPAGLDYLWLRPWSEDPRDVIILRQGEVMPRPEAKIRIGVSSARREAYCRERFPDASLEPLRGNIGERLAQLDEGRFDLLILAAAGLSRLGLAGRISEFIPLEKLEAPAGQGVLALAFREGDRLFNALRLAFVKPVIFAGAGPGPKELSTIATAKALSRCEICLYDSLVDESALSLLPPAAKAISVGKRMGRHSVRRRRYAALSWISPDKASAWSGSKAAIRGYSGVWPRRPRLSTGTNCHSRRYPASAA